MKSDRFTRALSLLTADAVRHVSGSLYRVQSQSSPISYVVDGASCDCPDGDRGNLCKHIFAAYSAAALAVACFRNAASEDALAAAGSVFARVSPVLPVAVVSAVRFEYRRCLAVFRAADHREVS